MKIYEANIYAKNLNDGKELVAKVVTYLNKNTTQITTFASDLHFYIKHRLIYHKNGVTIVVEKNESRQILDKMVTEDYFINYLRISFNSDLTQVSGLARKV